MEDLDEALAKLDQPKKRKYAELWTQLKANRIIRVYASIPDSLTIVNAVKKEKSKDDSKDAGYVLSSAAEPLDPTLPNLSDLTAKGYAVKLTFRLVLDTSIRAIKEL